MKRAVVLLAALAVASAWSCSDEEAAVVDCASGRVVEARGVTACLFERPKVVVETGFACPLGLPFRHNFDLLVFCSDAEIIPREVLGELAEGFLPLRWMYEGAAVAPVDLLFVIDDSHSMAAGQAFLVEYAGRLLGTVAELGASFHVAVVTTDVDLQDGAFRTAPGGFHPEGPQPEGVLERCPDVTGPVLTEAAYLMDPAHPELGVDVDRLQSDFRCLALAGTLGSGFEQGLEAMRRALSPDRLAGSNTGFRRVGAWLVVIFIADENDCSGASPASFVTGNDCEWKRHLLTPVDEYIEFLNTLPGTVDGNRVLVGAITGPDDGVRFNRPEVPLPTCANPERGDGYSGYRYHELAAAYGARGVVGSICEPWDDPVDDVRALVMALLGGSP
jgi:hypothetical protein